MPCEGIILDLLRLKLKAAKHVVQCLPPILKSMPKRICIR